MLHVVSPEKKAEKRAVYLKKKYLCGSETLQLASLPLFFLYNDSKTGAMTFKTRVFSTKS